MITRNSLRNWKETASGRLEELSQTKYGFSDQLHIPAELSITHGPFYKLVSSGKLEDQSILFIFTHTGFGIPEPALRFANTQNLEMIDELILLNHDAGTRNLASRLMSDMEKGLPAVILFYEGSRIFGDVNRLRRHEQIVHTPYRGGSPWSVSPDHELIASRTLDPFIQEYVRLCKMPNWQVIVYPHTMDTYGGGNASGDHEHGNTQVVRPAAMIFGRYSFLDEPYGIYGSKKGTLDTAFMGVPQMKAVQQTLEHNLNQAVPESVAVTIDRPYSSPRQLPGLGLMWTHMPHLVVDMRKDLFKDHGKAMYGALLNATQAIHG